ERRQLAERESVLHERRADAVRAPEIQHADRFAAAELSPQQDGGRLEIALRLFADRVLEPVHLGEVRVRRRGVIDGVEAGLDLVRGVVAGHLLRLAGVARARTANPYRQ